jgi:hypothetical protein
MNQFFKNESDTGKLRFKPCFKLLEFGRGKTQVEWHIEMTHYRPVGVTKSQRAKTFVQAARAAKAEIALLEKRRLFIIPVLPKHINRGEASNCWSCALSLALTAQRERLLLPTTSYGDRCFRVSSYGAWVDGRGIQLMHGYDEVARLPVEQMPDIATPWMGGVSSDGLVEWTQQWDDWASSRYMSLKEWRENHDYEDGERPYKPRPCSFVLDADAFIQGEDYSDDDD